MQITTPISVPSNTPFDSYTDYLDFSDDSLDSNEMFEGSGDLATYGSGDNKECHGDDEDCNVLEEKDSSNTPLYTPKITTEETFTSSRSPTPFFPEPTDEIDFEPEDTEAIDDSNYNYQEPEDPDISTTTDETIFNQEGTDVPIVFGPPNEDIPTFLYDNRILVVAIYSSLVFLLVSSILVVSIVVGVKHCRKKMGFVRVSGEDGSSTDSTASSDLPIIKKVLI